MSALLQTLVPIFGLLALGFAACRAKLIDQAGARGLVLFVFNFSIPALLLTSMAGLELPDDLDWRFLIAFYVGSLATYGLGLAVGRVPFRRALAEQAIFGMGAAFSNLVLIGIPVVLTALGPDASLPMLAIIGLHSATFMPLTVLLIQAEQADGGSMARRAAGLFADVLRNPIILGILAGLLVNLTGVALWTPVSTILDLLGAAAVPCALFTVGASLAGFPLAGDLAPSLTVTGLKLVVHPLLVWLVAVPVLGADGLAVDVAVLMAAMPSAVNVYLFGERYAAAAGMAARTVLLTTFGSMVTIAAVLVLLGV